MGKTLKMFGIIAFALIIGLSMTACDLGDDCVHEYPANWTTTAATCTDASSQSKVCTLCGGGKVFDLTYTPTLALGHQRAGALDGHNENWCTTPNQICSRTDCTVALPALPHRPGPSHSGSCTNGYTCYYCGGEGITSHSPTGINPKSATFISCIETHQICAYCGFTGSSFSIWHEYDSNNGKCIRCGMSEENAGTPPEEGEGEGEGEGEEGAPTNMYAIFKIADTFYVIKPMELPEDLLDVEEEEEIDIDAILAVMIELKLSSSSNIDQVVSDILKDVIDNGFTSCTIYLGDRGEFTGNVKLDIGNNRIDFGNGWSNKLINLGGSITSSNTASTSTAMGTIRITGNNVTINSDADIECTGPASSAIQFNGTGNLIITGGTISSSPSTQYTTIHSINTNDHNSTMTDSNVNIFLGGTPTITGTIFPSGSDKLSVFTSGYDEFHPDDNVYKLHYYPYAAGIIAVVNGKNYIDSFTVNTGYTLVEDGNNLKMVPAQQESRRR
ncbi:MAG: hypothetical protein FWC03_06555 [Treponema sp.]|nr:hypothetical protein [Treponema sp.]